MPWPRHTSRLEALVPADVPDAGLSAADDARLVAAARANPDAFTLLYRRYANLVYRYCDLRLGSREAAEDATSEVFTRVLASLGNYRGGLFAGWLFRIARNVVIDAQRTRGRDRVAVELDAASDILDTRPMPDEHVIARADVAAVQAALATLTDDYRTVIDLQVTGLSTEEIAVAMGRSPNAVRVLRFRALRQLRDLLASAGELPQRGGAR